MYEEDPTVGHTSQRSRGSVNTVEQAQEDGYDTVVRDHLLDLRRPDRTLLRIYGRGDAD
jgi:hypothetical protein